MPKYKNEKKIKLLVKPKLYSVPRQDSQTAPFPKTVNGFWKKLHPRLTNKSKNQSIKTKIT